jgi:hypothetical protein
MDLIDRLRGRWRHPDPEVRAAAVREMAGDEARLGAIARDDPDAAVRRIAIGKLSDVAMLESLTVDDPEPALRALAADRLHEVLCSIAASSRPPSECAAALARLTDERAIAHVAATAAHDEVRRAALERTVSERGLRDVARGAADASIRREAIARMHDPSILRGLAVSEHMPDLALQALARIDDPETLRAIADHRGAPKVVRAQARERLAALPELPSRLDAKAGRARQLELSTIVHALRAQTDVVRAAERVREARREWEELAGAIEPREEVGQRFRAACDAILADAALVVRRQTEVAGARAALEARVALCVRVESLDGADALEQLAAAREAWARLSPRSGDAHAEVARRFEAAARECAARSQRFVARERLEALVGEAEALADGPAVPPAKAWKALERRLADLDDGTDGGTAALRERFAGAGERLRRRRHDADRERDDVRRQNLIRLDALCDRLDEMVQAEGHKPGALRRQLDAAEAALRDLPPLPASERRDVWVDRLTDARGRALRRLRELEETEEWRRWANAAAQEEIIQRVEALLESNDLREGVRQLVSLQRQWEQVATASPDKSRALWERFRSARTELRARCDAYLVENLRKKSDLCDQVAALGDSTAWAETAEQIKRLQAEWKAIGPVPGHQAKALWERFREPCDRFFSRRTEHFERVQGARRDSAQRKTALCERAEALAESTDWETAAAAIKELQAAWKGSGPAGRLEGEALWARFRAACDRFFDRYRRRDELARDAAAARAVALCERAEGLAADQGVAPEAIARELDAIWAEWVRLEVAEDLGERLRAACEHIAGTRPEGLRGTRLDPEHTRKPREKLCRRLEELHAGLGEPAQPRSLQEMALALRDRLAANTIAGGNAGRVRRQEAAGELARVAAAWARLGPAVGEEGRSLTARFEDARDRLRGLLESGDRIPADGTGRR